MGHLASWVTLPNDHQQKVHHKRTNELHWFSKYHKLPTSTITYMLIISEIIFILPSSLDCWLLQSGTEQPEETGTHPGCLQRLPAEHQWSWLEVKHNTQLNSILRQSLRRSRQENTMWWTSTAQTGQDWCKIRMSQVTDSLSEGFVTGNLTVTAVYCHPKSLTISKRKLLPWDTVIH